MVLCFHCSGLVLFQCYTNKEARSKAYLRLETGGFSLLYQWATSFYRGFPPLYLLSLLHNTLLRRYMLSIFLKAPTTLLNLFTKHI